MTEALSVSALPQSWFRSQLREFCRIVSGATPKTSVSEFWGGPFPWVTPNDLSTHKAKVVVSGARSLTQAGYDSCSTRLVPAGSVLFTSRAPIGYVAIAGQSLCTNQGFKTAVPDGRIDSEYLYWHLQERTNSIRERASGTTFLEISAKGFGDTEINVPPLAEQRVIVDVLEGQFTLLDAVFESVRRSRVEAVRLRRALLRDAFSGVLTNPHLGPGELPAGWSRRQLVAVSELIRGVTYKKSQAVDHPADGFVPLVRATNIEVDHLLLNEFVYVPASVVREDQYLRSGDIVLAVSSGSSSVVGKSAMVREIGATTFGAFCGVLRPSAELLADFLRFVVQSPGIREMWSEAARGTNINNLKRDQIISTEIVIPPLAEQHEIVELLERELGLLDLALKAADRIEMEAKSFRRSLLHSAFNGELTREWRESNG